MEKKKSVINFGPGPAKLPEEVLEKAQLEFREFREHNGITVDEMSHRSVNFFFILKDTEQLLRDEMSIPSNYEVLFLQGGESAQFAAIPLNIGYMGQKSAPVADYAITGSWSDNAAKEASKYLSVNKVFSGLKQYTSIPDISEWQFNANAAYVYYCSDETIHGVEFEQPPEIKYDCVPLVADISSNILSQPFDVAKHGIAFAGTQNLGAAGLTVVIVRRDLLSHAHKMTPSVFSYSEQHKLGSVYNTPPVYSICLTKLVLDWIRRTGGVDELFERNRRKSNMIYDIIDGSQNFYYCPVDFHCRSRMNIPFRVGGVEGNEGLEKKFLEGAGKRGMLSLKGHESVGGIRASLYNAVTEAETEVLADYMKQFLDDFNNQEFAKNNEI